MTITTILQYITKYLDYSIMGQNLQYEIGREASGLPANQIRKLQKMLSLTIHNVVTSTVQEYDHDMADSSSPPSHKRSQLQIQLSNLQKKTRSALQPEHARNANFDLWLGFHTMELLATDNDAPLQEVNTSIRDLIRKGYKENEAAEIHTAKISFPRIPQLKWPSERQDGRLGHHYHLT